MVSVLVVASPQPISVMLTSAATIVRLVENISLLLSLLFLCIGKYIYFSVIFWSGLWVL